MDEKHKLLRVTLEFDDETRMLQGDAAEDWMQEMNSAAFTMWNYGQELKRREWEVTRRVAP